MMKKALLFCMVLFFIALPALGEDLVAVYQYSNGQTVNISTRDAEHIRMDTSQDSYMLLKGEKVYSVQKDEDGQWNVLDMDQMQGIGGKFMNFFGKMKKTPTYEMKLEYTGKKETVAGYKGKVYKATTLEDGKVVDTKELVLCDKPEIERINDAWVVMASRMAQMSGGDTAKYLEQSSKAAKENNYGGMIRAGDDMKLQSLTRMSLSSSHYELPGNAEMTDVQEPLQQMEKEQSASESKAGKVISQDAKDIGQSAHDEVKDATMDEVRDGVRSLFNGLFN